VVDMAERVAAAMAAAQVVGDMVARAVGMAA